MELHLPRILIIDLHSSEVNTTGLPAEVLYTALKASYQLCLGRLESTELVFNDICAAGELSRFKNQQTELVKRLAG